MYKAKRFILMGSLVPLAALIGGCSLSPTALSCGVSDNESYVTLENVKDNAPQTMKVYAELCGFAYQAEPEPVAKLNIIDATK